MGLVRIPGLRRLAQRTGGVREGTVLFESWHGRYSDNPRAIAEELHRRDLGLELVWVRGGEEDSFPEWASTVAVDTPAYLSALGRSQLLVTNNTVPGYYRKRREQTYLQTWHGTPLKRIGFDIPQPSPMMSPSRRRHLARESASWDGLISPNRFSTDVFRGAFGFEGEIVESGYPRNDALVNDSGEIRAQVRRALGLAENVLAVLYAPTLRDGAAFRLELDLDAVGRALGESCTVLLRAHEQVARSVRSERRENLIDVSGAADIADLYLAADVLVTDYSSAMFDFAVTGKPILFFTYDLADYRDRLRGFYFDFEREAPGPLLETSAQVIEALDDLSSLEASHRDAYAAFRERFCSLEDGGAAARACNWLLAAVR